jgi:hypothetical protein
MAEQSRPQSCQQRAHEKHHWRQVDAPVTFTCIIVVRKKLQSDPVSLCEALTFSGKSKKFLVSLHREWRCAQQKRPYKFKIFAGVS